MNNYFEETVFIIVVSVVVILFFALLVVYGYKNDNPKTYCIDNVQYLEFSSGDVTVAYTTDGKPKYCSN